MTETCHIELPLAFLFLFALSGSIAVLANNAVDKNIPYVSASTLEKDDLMLKMMSTMIESLQSIEAQVVENKHKALDLLKLEAKIDKLVQKEEETEKYVEQMLDNMYTKITSSLTDSTNAILSALNGNTKLLQEETSTALANFSKMTKDHLSGMEIKISKNMEASQTNIQEMNDKLTEIAEEAKKETDFSGMIQNSQQSVETKIIPIMAEISKQVSHVSERTTSAKSSLDEVQKQISSSVSSLEKEVKGVYAEMKNLKKDVVDAGNKLQTMESKLSAAVTFVGNNIITAVSKVESGIENKLSHTALEDRNHIKSIIHDTCGLKSMSGPSNCAEIQQSGQTTSGIYTIIISSAPLQVYCDMETEGGGWTVIQRRDDVTPHVDFYRYWTDYKQGFGDLNKEFWLGLDAIYGLTSRQSMSLRVDLEDLEGSKRFAFYRQFSIGNEWDKYRLFIEGYQGNAGDSMHNENGNVFSTRERDNDASSKEHCAEKYHGAWWYRACHQANLNGQYLRGEHKSFANGINWLHWRGYHYSLKKTEMKIRPIQF